MENTSDTAGVECLREIDQYLLKQARDYARFNNLTSKEQEHIVRSAVAAGRRCEERVERSKRAVSSDALNLAIQRTCHRYLFASCSLIRQEIAEMFTSEAAAAAPATPEVTEQPAAAACG